MATLITMPAIAADSTSAVLGSWLAAEGAELAAGDALADIETEKATVEFEAPEAGTLARLLVAAGAEVQVGAPIAVLTAPGETEDAIAALLGASLPDAAVPGSRAGGAEGAGSQADAAVPGSELPPAPAGETPAAAPAGAWAFASPLARRLAKDAGLRLDEITGSGPSGRVLRGDVEAAVAARAARPAAPAGAGTRAAAAPSGTVPTPAQASGPAAASSSPTSGPGAPVPEGAEEVKVTRMRGAIARRLTESKTTVPHFYLSADVRMDELLALRQRINAAAPRKITVNDLIVKAVAAALVAVPEANVRWDNGRILRFAHADISVAIATEDGLVTPVVTGAEQASVSDVSARVADFVARAKENRLRPEEISGGMFSVSNLGMFGTREFTAILNPPQSGILAVGAASPRPVVEPDGTLGVASLMTVTLSADHRVIDGAVAARWMNAFTEAIQRPLSLLI
jgi:pyruvate dehydrogenase E2 component (dihydrolipoamide acetyltransferase)